MNPLHSDSHSHRTQQCYSLRLKLRVVREIEHGLYSVREAAEHYGVRCDTTVCRWLQKYGVVNRELHIEELMEKPMPPIPAANL